MIKSQNLLNERWHKKCHGHRLSHRLEKLKTHKDYPDVVAQAGVSYFCDPIKKTRWMHRSFSNNIVRHLICARCKHRCGLITREGALNITRFVYLRQIKEILLQVLQLLQKLSYLVKETQFLYGKGAFFYLRIEWIISSKFWFSPNYTQTFFLKCHKIEWYYIEFTWARKPYVANDNKKAFKKRQWWQKWSRVTTTIMILCVSNMTCQFFCHCMPPCRTEVVACNTILRGPDQ